MPILATIMPAQLNTELWRNTNCCISGLLYELCFVSILSIMWIVDEQYEMFSSFPWVQGTCPLRQRQAAIWYQVLSSKLVYLSAEWLRCFESLLLKVEKKKNKTNPNESISLWLILISHQPLGLCCKLGGLMRKKSLHVAREKVVNF